MQVVMTKNLGSRDGAALGLKYTECTKGQTVTASDDVAEVLVKRGLASLVGETMKAVPAAPVAATPEAPAVKGK